MDDNSLMQRAIELALLAEEEGNLPPYFRDRFGKTQWMGPILPALCDPLYERLLAIERAR